MGKNSKISFNEEPKTSGGESNSSLNVTVKIIQKEAAVAPPTVYWLAYLQVILPIPINCISHKVPGTTAIKSVPYVAIRVWSVFKGFKDTLEKKSSLKMQVWTEQKS